MNYYIGSLLPGRVREVAGLFAGQDMLFRQSFKTHKSTRSGKIEL